MLPLASIDAFVEYLHQVPEDPLEAGSAEKI